MEGTAGQASSPGIASEIAEHRLMTTVRQQVPQGERAFGLKALAAFLMILAGSSIASAGESPAAYMQRVASELLAAQKSGSDADYATVIRSHADIPSIGLSALGDYAQVLPKSDRPAYFAGMVNFIAHYAATDGPKYPVARAIVTGQTKETVGGIYVDSRVTLATGESYDVRWRLVRRGTTFKVREAEILGFEMTTFLNNLFQSYISDNGGNPKALLLALNR
jgi:phospholipid transport system substrate-binding protein